jgi:hypothetical protein
MGAVEGIEVSGQVPDFTVEFNRQDRLHPTVPKSRSNDQAVAKLGLDPISGRIGNGMFVSRHSLASTPFETLIHAVTPRT